MTVLSDILGYVWTAAFLIGWIIVTYMFIQVAIKGRFGFWRRKANGKTWPPVRAETPARFWLVWFFMAGPFLFITFMFVVGLSASLGERF
ncbi:MAG TPA: hypothetical protein PKD99_16265 [Sphingopyxis sp.]|nr:hypothetical protein [Sphingopyxis sp.]HMP46656.1 hypothetical protein [Sphingopyxis sp.]HMQ19060.1 hypothetical protein [Sphingopyxis sp.]